MFLKRTKKKKIDQRLFTGLNIHERFSSLLKDKQQLSVNDIELTSLGKNIKAAQSSLPHKVKAKQREKNI